MQLRIMLIGWRGCPLEGLPFRTLPIDYGCPDLKMSAVGLSPDVMDLLSGQLKLGLKFVKRCGCAFGRCPTGSVHIHLGRPDLTVFSIEFIPGIMDPVSKDLQLGELFVEQGVGSLHFFPSRAIDIHLHRPDLTVFCFARLLPDIIDPVSHDLKLRENLVIPAGGCSFGSPTCSVGIHPGCEDLAGRSIVFMPYEEHSVSGNLELGLIARGPGSGGGEVRSERKLHYKQGEKENRTKDMESQMKTIGKNSHWISLPSERVTNSLFFTFIIPFFGQGYLNGITQGNAVNSDAPMQKTDYGQVLSVRMKEGHP
jgi:hypothetical protein